MRKKPARRARSTRGKCCSGGTCPLCVGGRCFAGQELLLLAAAVTVALLAFFGWQTGTLSQLVR